ncbi:MAG: protein phosphatase 2C domain-containing protein [Austwickia sp.]|nr:serine/threonine-protein phosphatase [Austwickia sp.]MCO5307694.1 protein phosphatase 2C domain-containing protein [Austwickia sp.]
MTELQTGLSVCFGAATSAGRLRTRNEDAYLAAPPILLVADGMGGHARGEAASRAVVEAFRPLGELAWVTAAEVTSAVLRAQDAVHLLRSGARGEPGSTVSGVALTQQRGVPCWLVFNIGDSRTYRLRADHLEQVSVDHSQAQALIDDAGLTAAQARRMAARHVITRAIGGGLPDHLAADEWLLFAATGDRLLLCTDGLTTELTDHLIRAILLTVPDPQVAAQSLVDAAVTAGGRDNVTAIVVDAVEVQGAAIPDDEVDTVSVPPESEETVDVDTLPLAEPGLSATPVSVGHRFLFGPKGRP